MNGVEERNGDTRQTEEEDTPQQVDRSTVSLVEEEGSEVDEDGMTTNSATVGDSRLRCDSLNSIPEISLPEYIKNSGDATSTQDSECRSGGYMSLHEMLTRGKVVNVRLADGSVSTSSVPFLYAVMQEARPIVRGFLFELKHVSECSEQLNHCSYPWCSPLKRDLSHASICTDTQCKMCSILRMILLVHSRQCVSSSCSLPFCNQYRTAWNSFIMSMSGCPAPDFSDLFSFNDLSVLDPIAASTSVSHQSAPVSVVKSESSTPVPISPASERPITSIPHSPVDLTIQHPHSSSISQSQSPMIGGQGDSKEDGVLRTGVNCMTVSNHRRDMSIATHYIECCKCQKKRAVPISLEETMLPNFECSMNIWDPKYSNCNVPENIMSNYTVNIAIHTPTYMREQAELCID